MVYTLYVGKIKMEETKMRTYVTMIAMILTVMFVWSAAPVFAADEPITTEVTRIDKECANPEAAKVVAGNIEKKFNVTAEQVKGLRDQKLGYGEIAAVYSIASKMEGGITDANVQKVVALRETSPKTGWGKIAKDLGMNPGDVKKDIRATKGEMKGGGREKHGRPEGKEKHEHMRPEKAGNR